MLSLFVVRSDSDIGSLKHVLVWILFLRVVLVFWTFLGSAFGKPRQGFLVAEESKDIYLARVLEAWPGSSSSFKIFTFCRFEQMISIRNKWDFTYDDDMKWNEPMVTECYGRWCFHMFDSLAAAVDFRWSRRHCMVTLANCWPKFEAWNT